MSTKLSNMALSNMELSNMSCTPPKAFRPDHLIFIDFNILLLLKCRNFTPVLVSADNWVQDTENFVFDKKGSSDTESNSFSKSMNNWEWISWAKFLFRF